MPYVSSCTSGLREARGQFGVAYASEPGGSPGEQERDRRRLARSRDHRTGRNIDPGADDDAEAIEEQRPEGQNASQAWGRFTLVALRSHATRTSTRFYAGGVASPAADSRRTS